MARLPIDSIYKFASEHGFSTDVERIRSLRKPPNDPKFRMTSTKRSYMAELLEENGLLEEFFKECWPEGLTHAGNSELRSYNNRRAKYERYMEDEDINDEDPNEIEDREDAAFAYEADLQNYLVNNLQIIENGLELYSDDRGTGKEYPVDGGRIDILAKDNTGRFVVIELKLSRGRNKAIGQLLYYMAWIDANMGNQEKCRGILIAKDIGSDVMMAVKRAVGVELFEYKLQVSVQRISE